MTTNSKDKTREKLMGSMRKTKVDAGIGSDSTETETTATPLVTPPVNSDKENSVTKTNRTTRVTPSQPQMVKPDSYQSGRRIWPD